MAYISGNRKINPLDINRNITIGVAFPLNENNIFSGTKNIKEQIKSNLINLLLTEPGERINEPNFGVGLKNLLFEQDHDINILKQKLENQIEFYIPIISLLDLNINKEKDPNHTHPENKLFLTLSYRFNTDNSTDAIRFNFDSSYFPRGNG